MHQLENLNCGGVEEFIYRKLTKCSDLNLIDLKLTINLNKSCYSTIAFSGEQNLKRHYSLFLKRPVKSPISSCSRLKKGSYVHVQTCKVTYSDVPELWLKPFISFKTDLRVITNKYQVPLHFIAKATHPIACFSRRLTQKSTCRRNFGRCFERISSIANFTASSWNTILASPKQKKNIFGKTFPKTISLITFLKTSFLWWDSLLNIHVFQSLLALGEGDPPDR